MLLTLENAAQFHDRWREVDIGESNFRLPATLHVAGRPYEADGTNTAFIERALAVFYTVVVEVEDDRIVKFSQRFESLQNGADAVVEPEQIASRTIERKACLADALGDARAGWLDIQRRIQQTGWRGQWIARVFLIGRSRPMIERCRHVQEERLLRLLPCVEEVKGTAGNPVHVVVSAFASAPSRSTISTEFAPRNSTVNLPTFHFRKRTCPLCVRLHRPPLPRELAKCRRSESPQQVARLSRQAPREGGGGGAWIDNHWRTRCALRSS